MSPQSDASLNSVVASPSMDEQQRAAYGFKFYEKVAEDAGRTITFAFIGVGILWPVAHWLPTIARLLFWADVVLMAWATVHFVLITFAGVITSVGWYTLGDGRLTRGWAWAAQGTRLVELVLCLVALWLAAKVVHYY